MSDELKQVQVMFEQIRSDVRAVAEGHSVLLNAISRVDDNLDKFKMEIKSDLKSVHDKLDDKLEEFRNETKQSFKKLTNDLALHSKQSVPPAHISFS